MPVIKCIRAWYGLCMGLWNTCVFLFQYNNICYILLCIGWCIIIAKNIHHLLQFLLLICLWQSVDSTSLFDVGYQIIQFVVNLVCEPIFQRSINMIIHRFFFVRTRSSYCCYIRWRHHGWRWYGSRCAKMSFVMFSKCWSITETSA